MNQSSSTSLPSLTAEWLEADGLGGFASGTVGGARTRRYHALLLTAQTPPTGRLVLANGFDAWVETGAGSFALSSQRYTPDVTHPDGASRLVEFTSEPWPRWVFALPDGTRVVQEIWVPHERAATVVTWKLIGAAEGARLHVRPFLSGRDYHALHHENADFRFDPHALGECVEWCPYPGIPRIASWSNATYRHDPRWYRNFQYDEERSRGLDGAEDLASPGELTWNLSGGEAVWLLAPDETGPGAVPEHETVLSVVSRLRAAEQGRRTQFPSPLHRAADAYIVRRGDDRTIIAGYPWFTDWGRDTFIALRGLCLATGRLGDARGILLSWARSVSLGMVPNRFPDRGEQPEFNAVDASLWFIVAVHEFLEAARARRLEVKAEEHSRLVTAVEAILEGFTLGTRHHIHVTGDGLLAAGEPGVQLTWMDAKVGDWVVTPRIGKPVEVQALWVNALWIGAGLNARWRPQFERARTAFGERFWNEDRKCLFDVVDQDHVAGRNDASLRPNQIFAVGGLPLPLLDGERARLVVDVVEDQLLTPLGLRSLAAGEPGYAPRYEGGVWQRDGAYHQGTVWPWLIGAFVEAWLRVHGNTTANRQVARRCFVAPLLTHLGEAGLGHISEIADATMPYSPRGCPWQAWSVGELLRLEQVVLAAPAETEPAPLSSARSKTGGRSRPLVPA
ncbi:MAG TPA: amylo-alpha-1,6-glucosidase [Candidatus Limnocylindria bacterium]|nr:amylo-alpha-1,6-glucosidase [Candidatus Limnocylindria bacterium]